MLVQGKVDDIQRMFVYKLGGDIDVGKKKFLF